MTESAEDTKFWADWMAEYELKREPDFNALETVGFEAGKMVYPDLDDDDKTIIAFGMTPITVLDPLTEAFHRAIASKFNPDWDEERIVRNIAYIRKDVTQAYQRGFCRGLRQAASDFNQMIA